MPFSKRKHLPMAAHAVRGRVCWLCAHVKFETGERGYSELTPGTAFSLECAREYWRFDQNSDDLETFRKQLESAQRCADFVRRIDG